MIYKDHPQCNQDILYNNIWSNLNNKLYVHPTKNYILTIDELYKHFKIYTNN